MELVFNSTEVRDRNKNDIFNRTALGASAIKCVALHESFISYP